MQRFDTLIVIKNMNHQHPAGVVSGDMITRCKAGDVDAFAQLYTLMHDKLLGVAMSYVADVEEARDVEHDAWVMILTSLDSLSDVAKAESWMCRIVRNTALNNLKHVRRKKQVPIEQAEVVSPESEVEPLPPLPVMMDMVAHLPVGYGQVFRLHAFDNLTHRQIADLLGISESTSRSQLSHARQMLRQMMRRYWALFLLALLAPLAVLLFMNRKTKMEGSQPTTAKVDDKHQAVEPLSPAPPVSPTSVTAPHSYPGSVLTVDVGSRSAQSQSAEPLLADSGSQLTATPEVLGRLPVARMDAVAPGTVVVPHVERLAGKVSPSRRQPLQMHLAYGGAGSGTTVIDNFLTVVNFAAGEAQRNLHLYTWGDYDKYVAENAALMDSVDALAMQKIAKEHQSHYIDSAADDPQAETPLSETKHHERPMTFMLSFSSPLTPRWNLTAGLGYTGMKSIFETDNGGGNHITRRTQKAPKGGKA